MRESRSGGYSLRKLEGRNDYNEAQHKSADHVHPRSKSDYDTTEGGREPKMAVPASAGKPG